MPTKTLRTIDHPQFDGVECALAAVQGKAERTECLLVGDAAVSLRRKNDTLGSDTGVKSKNCQPE